MLITSVHPTYYKKIHTGAGWKSFYKSEEFLFAVKK
jgi:hypothetical protein